MKESPEIPLPFFPRCRQSIKSKSAGEKTDLHVEGNIKKKKKSNLFLQRDENGKLENLRDKHEKNVKPIVSGRNLLPGIG